MRIEGCPNEYCQPLTTAIHMAELFAKGMPPVAGGALDQSAWFLQFERSLRCEDALVRADSHE